MGVASEPDACGIGDKLLTTRVLLATHDGCARTRRRDSARGSCAEHSGLVEIIARLGPGRLNLRLGVQQGPPPDCVCAAQIAPDLQSGTPPQGRHDRELDMHLVRQRGSREGKQLNTYGCVRVRVRVGVLETAFKAWMVEITEGGRAGR